MQWLLVLSQSGGCDYTIGCGYAFETIEADNEQEARERAREYLDREGYLDTSPFSSKLDYVEMYELARDCIDLPLEEWRDAKEEEEQAEIKKQAELKRRRQYEQLKREFEGS